MRLLDEQSFRLQGAIRCLHGENLRLGGRIYISAGCCIRDEGPVEIGDDVILGPGVALDSATNAGVTIGSRVWIGDNVEIRPGVSIGDGAMICAGSLVETDVPPNAVAEGRPSKVVWYLR